MKIEKEMTGWIPVEKELPEDLKNVLVTCEVERFFRSDWYRELTSVDGEILIKKLQYVETAYLDTDTWVISGWSSPYPKVTAWRPLPKHIRRK